MSTRAPLLAEERRLLIAAMGRRAVDLVVTAVDDSNGDDCALPSPFFDEVAAWATAGGVDLTDRSSGIAAPPVLSAAAPRRSASVRWCVLRSVPVAEANAKRRQSNSRGSLMRDVPGADPSQRHGTTALSTRGCLGG